MASVPNRGLAFAPAELSMLLMRGPALFVEAIAARAALDICCGRAEGRRGLLLLARPFPEEPPRFPEAVLNEARPWVAAVAAVATAVAAFLTGDEMLLR